MRRDLKRSSFKRPKPLMKSHKNDKKNFPTTTQLRPKDPKVLRAELDLFRQKITDKITHEPAKAAFVLSDWLNKPALSRKKTAA